MYIHNLPNKLHCFGSHHESSTQHSTSWSSFTLYPIITAGEMPPRVSENAWNCRVSLYSPSEHRSCCSNPLRNYCSPFGEGWKIVSTVYRRCYRLSSLFYGFYNDLINRNSTSLSPECIAACSPSVAVSHFQADALRCAPARCPTSLLLSNLIEINLPRRKLV